MEVETGMRICGLKLRHALLVIFGAIFLFPPATPVGLIIIASAYLSAVADAKKEQRESYQKMMEARNNNEEYAVEYEEVDEEEYPDPTVEFNKKDFLENARKWI